MNTITKHDRRNGMSEPTIRRLANVEYDFFRIDEAVTTLGQELHRSAHEAPSCTPAVLALKKLRRDLRKVFETIAEDVRDAIAAAETLPGAPF